MAFVLPTLYTWYDLLNSTIEPVQLFATAERRKITAIGIVDHATTLGHVRIAQAAKDSSVHVVFGTTLMMEGGSVVRLLARDDDGYRNLCRLVSLQARGQAALPWEAIHTYQRGLYVLCGGRRGRLWQTLCGTRPDDRRALWTLAQMQALVEQSEHFAIEVQRYPDDGEEEHRAVQQLLLLAKQAGVRTVATHDVHVLGSNDSRIHRLLGAIQHRSSFFAQDPRLPHWVRGTPSRHALPTPKQWHANWQGLEHLVAGSAQILNDCRVELLGRRRFPGARLPPDDVFHELWSRAFAGLKQHYQRVTPALMDRLQREISAVQEQGVGAFLLCAANLVERADKRGIRMILQGSGTGSLLCFALGISPVDPLTQTALVFERFAGKHRGSGDLPDLDFAVAAGREDEIRSLLIEMYGVERVARLATVPTFHEPSALRAVAQAFGWDEQACQILHQKQQQAVELDRYEQMLLHAAEAIIGQPATIAHHASGLIVADEPFTELVGTAELGDGPVIQADKDDVEYLQLLKLDILSWYSLAIYDQAERTIQAAHHPQPDLWHVAGEDALTGALLERAETRCIPYLQSPACMTLLRTLKVRSEADIAICVGALRPGASSTRPRVVAAMRGGDAPIDGWQHLSREHQQLLGAVLLPSRGAFIFDEDLLNVAHALGLSLADAERLRKAYKKKGEDAAPWENKLRTSALNNGWRDSEIDVILGWFKYIERYTFCRGHAVAMAHVAWRVARIAAHYPAHFFAAVLDHLGPEGGGMYPRLVYVTEARRNHLVVLGPTVNSAWASMPRGNTIQCGLGLLQGVVSATTLATIQSEARLRPFESVSDFIIRVAPATRDWECLVAAGALDQLTRSRRQARWEAQGAKRRPKEQSTLFAAWEPTDLAAIEPESVGERAAEEYGTLGFCMSVDHPLTLYADRLRDQALVTTEQLADYLKQEVTIAAIVVAGRRILTSTDRVMIFVSLCDRTGITEAALFGDVAERYGELVSGDHVVLVTGLVTEDVERGIGLSVGHVQIVHGPLHHH
ncbi:MAG: DNA polymerase III subunit alpha [Herpetosiphonaceae bacterium]|nr:DNA polymerase III subunit alpha [Herpetosiphonaceae bacterium]